MLIQTDNDQLKKRESTVEMLSSVFAEFLSNHDVTEGSKRTYEKSFLTFLKFIKTNEIVEVDKGVLLRYKTELKETKSTYTVNLYLSVIKMFFSFLFENGKIQMNTASSIKKLKQPKGFNKDPLTPSDAKKLLDSIDTATKVGKRDFAFLLLMITTGLRTNEVVNAQIDDVRPNSGETVLYIQGKGRDSKDEYVVINERVLDAIRDYHRTLDKPKDTDPLFKSFSNRNQSGFLTTKTLRRITKERLDDIGIVNDRLSAHSLRHTAVTVSLLSGATLQETKAMARHSDINATLIYAHNIDRVGNAAENKIADFLYK
tara:strand:+ start:2138 stop:3082 length:945 start_codon:yes stop_codon:yes gene_type:complete